jgi:hypothetical protein
MRRAMSVFVLIVLTTSMLRAQTMAGGNITGVVRDQQGAVVPDVVVTATSPSAPVVYRATTDRVGRYRLSELPPGDYTVSAERQGFSTFVRTPVTVRAGLSVLADVEMAVGAVGETVEVRTESPLLETRSGGQAVNVSGELLRSVPLAEGREWYGALGLAPGVVTSEFAGIKMLYIRGSESTAMIVQLDGADVTGAAKTGISYLNLNTDAVADIQIQTGGIRASSPLASGGVINVVTASGTNRLKGATTVFFQPRRWNDSNQPGGTSTSLEQMQLDVSAGGPLVRDHLWAFGALRRSDVTTGVSRTEAQLANLRGLLGSFEPIDSTRKANFWLGKLTAQAGSHHLSGFYQNDTNPASDIQATAEYPFTQATGGRAASFRVASAWSNRLTTTLSAGYNDKDREGEPFDVAGPSIRVFTGTIPSGGRLLGNGMIGILGAPVPTRLSQPNEKLTVGFDTSFYASRGGSSHELQAGLYYEHRVQGSTLTYTNGGFMLEEHALRQPGVLSGGTVPFHRTIVNGPELATSNQRTRDFAAYVQDAWQASPRLTLSGGVRFDRIVVDDRIFGLRAQESVDIGPRVGVNYAVTKDGRTVARAHWARVHDQPGIVTTTGNPSLGQRDLYDLNLDGTFETVFVTPPSSAAIANRTIDPDLHQPYVQEWGAGLSRQFQGSTAVNVDVSRRRFVDRPTLVETNGRYDGRVFTGYLDEAFNEIYTATNNQWNTPVYTSIELSATKRTARVQALASYVRQWRHLAGTWQPNDPASFIQPEAFANDTGIGSSTGTASAASDANSLIGHHMTQSATASAQWQDHVARIGVTLTAPWGLNVAGNYTYQSGAWSGPVVTRIAAADPAFGPPTVRLSNGRVVSNPLATVIRFAHPTRGDGQFRSGDFHGLNARVSRRFIVQRVTFDASLDVFNLTNNGADLGFLFGANQTYSPLFGQTTDRQTPRSAQLVFRAAF